MCRALAVVAGTGGDDSGRSGGQAPDLAGGKNLVPHSQEEEDEEEEATAQESLSNVARSREYIELVLLGGTPGPHCLGSLQGHPMALPLCGMAPRTVWVFRNGAV